LASTAWRTIVVFAVLSAGCSGSDDAGAALVGTVMDPNSEAPLPGALIVIEEGGLYRPIADPSKGSPAYQFGTRAGADGTFSIDVPTGDKGLHVFANGYRYWPSNQTIAEGETTEVTATPEPELPEDLQPTLSDPTFEPASVAAGGQATLHVTAKAGDAVTAPLSDEVLVVLPEQGFARALDPPSPGKPGQGYPDGVYSLSLTAPSEPGNFTYYVVASAENCVTTDTVTATLTVK
jgi:hypothetical protein